MLLASQFQGFCRDLHSECAEHIALAVTPRTLRTLVLAEFAHARRLDRGSVIVEDRGGLGDGGERVLRVRVQLDPWNTHEFEMPEDWFRAA